MLTLHTLQAETTQEEFNTFKQKLASQNQSIQSCQSAISEIREIQTAPAIDCDLEKRISGQFEKWTRWLCEENTPKDQSIAEIANKQLDLAKENAELKAKNVSLESRWEA